MNKGKNNSKRKHKIGEMETLAQIYSETVIQEAIKRKIDKEIIRRDEKEGKSFAEKYKVNTKEKERRIVYVLKIVEKNGIINQQGITEEEYLDDSVRGYKMKRMSKSYEVPPEADPFITIGIKDTRTNEQKEEDYRISKENRENKDKGMELI